MDTSFGPLNPTLVTDISNIRTKWDLNISYLDAELARTVCFGECFRFRPHIGARIYWMDQKLHLRAEFPIGVDTGVFASRIKERFNGYGIEGGFWGDWKVGCGVSVIGHVGGSVLYSKFRNRGAVSSTGIDSICFRDSFWTATPTLDYFIGLQYADCFCETLFSAHIGWEQHILFHANQFSHGAGNLATQGLTLGLDVSF